MTRRFPVVVTAQAAAQINDAALWWSENRPAEEGAIRDELERAFELLSVQPLIGTPTRST